MSSVRTSPLKPAATHLTVVGALAERHRRDGKNMATSWRDPRKLGDSLDLSPTTTMAQVNRAEMLGLIDRRTVEAGERITLTDLGWNLFGLDDRKPRKGLRSTQTLPEVEGRTPLVQLLIHWRSAVAHVEELADHLGQDVEAFWEEVLDAERSGDVETWPDHPAGPAVMLSGLVAERLDLVLSADGTRWLRPHDADPTSIDSTWQLHDRFEHVVGEAGLGGDPDEARMFDQLADPEALEGWEAAGLLEAGEREVEALVGRWTDPEGRGLYVIDRPLTQADLWGIRGRSLVRLPEPKLILGQGLAWPAERTGGEPCPGCHDARLGALTYCLVCSRSGLDDVIREILRYTAKPSRIRPHHPEKPEAGPKGGKVTKGRRASTEPVGLRGGIG